MARVILTEEARKKARREERLRTSVYAKLREKGLSLEDLGKIWDVSRQDASYRIRHASIRYEDLCRLFDWLGYSPEEIAEVMR